MHSHEDGHLFGHVHCSCFFFYLSLLENFQPAPPLPPPPIWTGKIFRAPSLLKKNKRQPTENHIDSIFGGNIGMIFQGHPFQTSKILRDPFLHQVLPPPSVCE